MCTSKLEVLAVSIASQAPKNAIHYGCPVTPFLSATKKAIILGFKASLYNYLEHHNKYKNICWPWIEGNSCRWIQKNNCKTFAEL
jgi:hypothetical protein